MPDGDHAGAGTEECREESSADAPSQPSNLSWSATVRSEKGSLPDHHFAPTDAMRHQSLGALMHYDGILRRVVGTGWSRRKLYLIHRMAFNPGR